MPEQQAATLATIFSEVLADMAFMFTEDDDTAPTADEGWLETTIAYRGPTGGDLTFRCTRAFTCLLATNLLGADGGDAEADDAVKEFMNIVCGQLVTALHGTQAVFDLTIPAIRHLDEAPDLTCNDGTNAATLSVEGCRVQLLYTPAP